MYKRVQAYIRFAPFSFFMLYTQNYFVILQPIIDTTKTYRDYETFIT